MSRSGSGPDEGRGLFAGSVFLAESAAMERGAGGSDLEDLTARNEIAVARLNAGRPLDAVEAWESLLVECRALVGEAHAATLVVEGNLATARFLAGREERGVQLMTANLSAREFVLGDEHHDTLTARDALATAYRLAGQLTEALALYSRVAAQRSRVLGPAHPDTLISRLGLALTRADTGDLQVARNVVAGALRDAEAAHGDLNVHTVTLRWCLGSLQAALGHTDQAAYELDRAQVDNEQLLGPDHPDTAVIRNELRQLIVAGGPDVPPPRPATTDRPVPDGEWPDEPAVEPLTAGRPPFGPPLIGGIPPAVEPTSPGPAG